MKKIIGSVILVSFIMLCFTWAKVDSTVPMVSDITQKPSNLYGSNINYGTSCIPVIYVIPGQEPVNIKSVVAGSVFGKFVFKPINTNEGFLKNRLFLGSVRLENGNHVQGYFNGNIGNVIEATEGFGKARFDAPFSIAFTNLREDSKHNVSGKAFACRAGNGNEILVFDMKSKQLEDRPGSPIQLSLKYNTTQALPNAAQIIRLSTLNMGNYLKGDSDTKFQDQLVIEFAGNYDWREAPEQECSLSDSIGIAHIDQGSGLLNFSNSFNVYKKEGSKYPDFNMWSVKKDFPLFDVITGGYIIGLDKNNRLGIYLANIYGYGHKRTPAFKSHLVGFYIFLDSLFIPFDINKDRISVDLASNLGTQVVTRLIAEYYSSHRDWAQYRFNIALSSGIMAHPYGDSRNNEWQYIPHLWDNKDMRYDQYKWESSSKAFTYEIVDTNNATYNFKTVENPLTPKPWYYHIPLFEDIAYLFEWFDPNNPDIEVDMRGSGPYNINQKSNSLASDINQAKEYYFENGYKILFVIYGQPFFASHLNSLLAFPIINFNSGEVRIDSTTKTKGSGFSYVGEHGFAGKGEKVKFEAIATATVSEENSFSESWLEKNAKFSYENLTFRYDPSRFTNPADYYSSFGFHFIIYEGHVKTPIRSALSSLAI